MDGLVIESISLLTLLEVGDVPHYEQLKPGDILLDFPGVWLALSEDWKGIYQHVLATPEGWYDELLLSRLLLKESTQSLCVNALAIKHLLASRNPLHNQDTYPELSKLWAAFYANVNDGSLSQMLAASQSIQASLVTEAEALLDFLLITHSTLRERQEGFESKHWDDYRAATEVARDDGSAIFSTYSNHFMLASVLLMHLKPNSHVLKDVALSWPPYLLYPNAGELLLIRTLLSHCYQKEGINFLVNNFEHIIPEHLLFLLEKPNSNAIECIAVKQAFFDKYQPQGYYPGANNSLENYTEYFDLVINRKSKRAGYDHL